MAMSILKNLQIRGITTMATTHYSELKVFAMSTKGVSNASCEFDVATFSPTYRLLIGIPGKSNAFAISGKLGLPQFIIDQARKNMDASDRNFEDLISDLENNRITIEKEQAELEKYKKEVETLKARLEAKHENLTRQKEKILREANEQAQKILQDAKDFADQTIRDMNKLSSGSGLNNKAMEAKRSAVRDKLNKVNSHLEYKPDKSVKNQPSDFKLGDKVKVLSLNINGIITSLPNAKNEVSVQMGILKSFINISDLLLLDEDVIQAPTLKRTNAGKIKMSKTADISPTINIIGKTVDEAMAIIDKYLDDAYLSHLPQVTIIHGRGTGALRNAVHNKLKKNSHVKSYRLGTFGEGETGVTIVDFK